MAKDDRDIFEVFDQVIALLTENRDNLLEIQDLLLKHGEASAQALSSATEKMFLGLSTKGRKRHSKSRSKAPEDKTLYCSFCGKSQHEVKKLVAGPTVFICDECAELCVDIVRGKAVPVDAGQDRNGDAGGS